MICGKLKELAMMGLQAAGRGHGLLLLSEQAITFLQTLREFCRQYCHVLCRSSDGGRLIYLVIEMGDPRS
jgi:hypothetical protein